MVLASTLFDFFIVSFRFDCGFFGILYMENFNAKVMLDFDNNAIPDLRKSIAASLIENRENTDNVENILEEELQQRPKYT